MTYQEIYDFTTKLCSDQIIDTDSFNSFLDVAQMLVEDLRPWVLLHTEDATQSASPSDSFTTAKNLATDFKEWYSESPLQLVDANYGEIYLTEVPLADRFKYRQSGGRFCVDYKTGKFYILGTLTSAYTIHQNYINLPSLVSAGNTWVFPERFHKILALTVASLWRHGIDYDIFNAVLADKQVQQAQAMIDLMTRWDSRLQQNMQRGKDFFDNNSIGQGSINGGVVSM